VKQPVAKRPAERAGAIGEQHQRRGGRQREAGPRRQPAEISGAHQPDGEADLAARRPRKKLAQRDQVGVALIVKPAATGYEFVTEISDVGDRSSETTHAQSEKDQQHVDCCAVCAAFRRRRMIGGRHRVSTN